ncbi:hypothetical protein ACTXT7_004625 [Hymenolepis weldensis]
MDKDIAIVVQRYFKCKQKGKIPPDQQPILWAKTSAPCPWITRDHCNRQRHPVLFGPLTRLLQES